MTENITIETKIVPDDASIKEKYCYICQKPTLTFNCVDLGNLKINLCTSDYLNVEVSALKAKHGDIGAIAKEKASRGFNRAKGWLKDMIIKSTGN